MPGSLTIIDALVIAAYGVAVVAIGVSAGRGHQTADDLTLGRRRMPTWAVLCSLVATELSAATFIGVPHVGYQGAWFYLQYGLGSLAARVVLAVTWIPLYHRAGVVTVYEFLDRRFGPRARRASALFFILGRILASGVRLYIAALAFAVVTGWRIESAIVVAGLLAGIYTLAGGIRAVIWTDTLQGLVFLVAALTTVVALGMKVDGGFGGLFEWAQAQGKLQVFQLSPKMISFSSVDPLLVGLIGGFVLTLATHGTDYDMVQRLLTTRDGRRGGWALLLSGVVNLPLVALFLFIGTGLAYFYSTGASYDISDTKRIFPLFILHELPVGLRGLVFAGLFAAAMSSFDSAICAMSTTWNNDVRRVVGERQLVERTRRSTAIFCGLLVVTAIAMTFYARATEATGARFDLVNLALSAMTIVYGGLLGVFLLGFCSARRGNEVSVIAALLLSSGVCLFLFLRPILAPPGSESPPTLVWPWWIVIGTVVSLFVASLPSTTKGADR